MSETMLPLESLKSILLNKDIVNKCSRIIVNSSSLVNYWIKGVTLHGEQKILRKITGFRSEEINVEIAHNIYRFISRT